MKQSLNTGERIDSQKIKAIAKLLDIDDTREIEMISENEYEHDDTIYYCVTYDEALEQAKDEIRDSIEKEINGGYGYDEMTMERLLELANDHLKQAIEDFEIDIEEHNVHSLIAYEGFPVREFIDRYINLYNYINDYPSDDNLINYHFTNYEMVDDFIIYCNE